MMSADDKVASARQSELEMMERAHKAEALNKQLVEALGWLYIWTRSESHKLGHAEVGAYYRNVKLTMKRARSALCAAAKEMEE